MAVCAPFPLLTYLVSLSGGKDTGPDIVKQTAIRFNFAGASRITMTGHNFLQQVLSGALDDAAATLKENWPAFKVLLDTIQKDHHFRPWHDPFDCRALQVTRDDLQDRLPMYAFQLGQAWLSNEMAFQIADGTQRPTAVDFGMEILNVLNGRELSAEALLHSLCLSQRMTPWAVQRTFLRTWGNTSLKNLVDMYPAPADFQVTFRTERVLAGLKGEIKMVSVPANAIILPGGEKFSILAPK